MHRKERWGLLLVGMTTALLVMGSYYVYGYVKRTVEERRGRELTMLLDQIVDGTFDKVTSAVDMLYDLRSMVISETESAQKWDVFMRVSELETRFPGIYTPFYAQIVDKEDAVNFERKLQKQEGIGYQNYVIFPKSDKDEYLPIKYLYTSDKELGVLLGADLGYVDRASAFSDSVLKDSPVISELIHLNILSPSSKKAGYMVILPVYDNPKIKDYPLKERKNFLLGFVGTWIAPLSLRGESLVLRGLRYTLFDGGQKVSSMGTVNEVRDSASKEIQILNRKFTMVLDSGMAYRLSGMEDNLPVFALIAAVIVNALWFIVVFIITSARRKALTLASLATKDLRKFKQAVDGVSDHVVITNPEGVITYVNKAAENITGYSANEMIGNRPSLWGGRMPKEYYEKFWKTIKYDKQPFWGELTNRRKSGELYEAELHVSPILDEEGNLLFFVGIERDISRMKAVDRMKTEFISLASHQLRTPLSAAKWFGEMLMDGDAGKLTRLQEKYVSKINESNEREIQLVNALLNVSRIESGKIIVSAKLTNLRKLVEGILGDMKVNIAGENKVLLYTVDRNVPEIVIDADLIKHVYVNLLSNAIKYTNQGGKIVVKIYAKGASVITEVIDNGIGIPKSEQKRIADKFFRGSNALKKETEGSGLGLYLAKTIVESSGGKIWFESTEGKGTTFKFSLPIRSIRHNRKHIRQTEAHGV